MALLPGKKLGARPLRFGHKGADVNQLHSFLRLQGYDLGQERDYGYLTKDAVRGWQQDHGLVADGIAGKRFFALALKKNLPIRRRVHIVKPGETLEQIAQNYDLGIQAFQRCSSKGTIYPGQHLIFFDREIWGICGNTPQDKTLLHKLTGLVCINSTGGLGKLPCVVRPESKDNDDVVEIHKQLHTPGKRKATVRTFLDSLGEDCAGLYIPWKTVAPLDGRRYLKLLRALRRRLKPPAMLWAELGPEVLPWKLWGGVDYSQVNELVDRVVLELPFPLELGISQLVGLLAPQLHSWKILLKVPVYALEWERGEGETLMSRLPYQTALSRAHRHGARQLKDEQGFMYYGYRKRGHDFRIYLPHLSSIAQVATLANRHNLAGLLLDELGMEDFRVWQTITSHFQTTSLIISDE